MHKTPYLSIIIPVYKVEKYLQECVESILASSFKDFEAILVDDCSPDGSGIICDALTNSDPRLRTIHKQVNEGPSAARNLGLEMVSGKWITFIDSDDKITPSFLENLVRPTLDDPKLDFVQAGCSFYKNNVVTGIAQQYDLHNGSDPAYLLNKFRGLTVSKMFKNEIIQTWDDGRGLKFDERIPCAEDMAFTLDYILDVRKYAFIPETGYYYRQDNKGSLSLSGKIYAYDRMYHSARKMYESLLKYQNKYSITNEQCPLRLAQRGLGFFSSIKILYKTGISRPERMETLHKNYPEEYCKLFPYAEKIERNKLRKFLIHLLSGKHYNTFDFCAKLIYGISCFRRNVTKKMIKQG